VAGIYIHIPFCKQACHYCNFHFSTSTTLQNDFTVALLKEMKERSFYLGGESIETIYFGGGTPSLLPDAVIAEILESLYRLFSLSPDPEITLESNPDDMAPERLAVWKEMGINRLSIGIQSFFDEDLNWMNRAHDASQAIRALEQTRKAGFDQFSLDLIYGSPGLSDEKWSKNLHKALSFNPPHISCYALTVEPKTALYTMIRTKKSADIRPDIQATQFLEGIETLESAGYEHYEISSFAKPGSRSRHNSSYWHSKKYLGLGPSAHSFNGDSRQWNMSNNVLYIKGVMTGQAYFESEFLQPRDLLNEYIMTSLRTREGLDLRQVCALFGEDKGKILELQAAAYIRLKQVENQGGKLVLTRDGKLFADGITSALFFD
jgi:oxygen-independent coproporphyrinogen III oxidase